MFWTLGMKMMQEIFDMNAVCCLYVHTKVIDWFTPKFAYKFVEVGGNRFNFFLNCVPLLEIDNSPYLL